MTPTADPNVGDDASVPPMETTLLRIVVGFRVVGMVWLIVLAVLTLVTEPSEIESTTRTTMVWSTIVIAVVWTAVTTALAYARPRALSTWGFLAIDLALAGWVAMTPGLIRTDIFFVGGYPISSPFLFATTRGMAATVAPALVVAIASAVGVNQANARALEVIAINSLSPLVVAWGFGLIKQQDAQRRAAEGALAKERTKLARADERAEMAAHLHDSVLQTLALIQRRAPENRDVTRVARRQERELRAWLNGVPTLAAGNTLSSAMIRAAEEVEDEYDILVEVSTAGDRQLDDRASGVVLAAREAMKNAARFAGVDRIFVLSESREDGVTVVVRDQGSGFDTTTVSEDRRGIRESIVGRLERVGGTATVTSAIGEGTEVELRLEEVEAR